MMKNEDEDDDQVARESEQLHYLIHLQREVWRNFYFFFILKKIRTREGFLSKKKGHDGILQ
jgi:hypothetical protein